MALTNAQRILRSVVTRRTRPQGRAEPTLSPWLLDKCRRNGWDPDDLRRIMAADNVAITAGAGTTIRTLDRSGVQTQQVGIDAAQSGESELLGLGHDKVITLTSAGLTTASTNYTAGDQMGTELSATFVRTGKGAIIQSAAATDKNKVLTTFDLYVTDASVTLASDNAAHSLSDADSTHLLGIISFDVRRVSANNHLFVATGGLPIVVKPGSGTTLYFHLVTTLANNFFGAVGDIVINVGPSQN